MKKPLSSHYIPVLDGFRALMLAMVSWYHVWQQSWLSPNLRIGGLEIRFEPYVRSGYMMVDGIILLSAFLLFLPYARHMLEGEGLPGLKPFYVRRVARIVPSYYAYLIGALLLIASYGSVKAMGVDLLRHATFTHTFWPESYMHSPLGMAVWTLAVEMQAYLLFPFAARLAVKKPWLILPLLFGGGLLYRGLVAANVTDYGMWLNQLPAFFDVYAIGMGLALLYVRLYRRVCEKRGLQAVFTLLALGVIPLLLALLRAQGGVSGQGPMQLGQMNRRLPISLLFGGLFLFTSLSLPFFRSLFGNRAARFFAGISFNYYMWHPVVALFLKKIRVPFYEADMPQMAGEMPWQIQYTALCFILSLAVAAAMTYLIEKPCDRLIQTLLLGRVSKRGGKKHEGSQNGYLSA